MGLINKVDMVCLSPVGYGVYSFLYLQAVTMEGVILKHTASFFNQSYMFTPSVTHLTCTWNTVLNLLRTVKPLNFVAEKKTVI